VTHTPHAWQLAAAEAYQHLGGVVVGLPPGAGKSYAAALIARECPRPLVIAPAAVIPQTRAMFEAYGVATADARHCAPAGRVAPVTKAAFASYTWLQRAEQADFFERFAPTDILMDEFHEVRNVGRNSAAKRLERYLIAHPAVRVGVFSASLVTDRLRDWAHGFTWALRGGARAAGIPPTRFGVEALEERYSEDPESYRAFLVRLGATPGVFLEVDGLPGYTGDVRVSLIEREPALTLPADWSLPDGYLLTSPAEASWVAKALAWGWWPKRTPRPSEAYLEARRAWSRVVQSVVATGAADTESQVRALRPEAYAAWWAVASAEPEGSEEVVWAEDQYLKGFLASQTFARPTIVWAYSRALQARVAALLACPHHGPGGIDQDGVRLDETRAPLVVASIEACHAGWNAQHFAHSLVLDPPSDPEVWRQLIGRTARQGQTSPVVTVEVVVNCAASRQSLRTAIERAKAVGKPNPILQLDGRV